MNSRKTFLYLLTTWFVINLLQAAFTNISNDEAYYSLWSNNLAWGYFDHPPMIALFGFLGSSLFDGNIGFRLLTVIAQAISIFIIWLIIDDKKAKKEDVILFFIICSSLIMFSALGFIATPDSPLLLFASLFLLYYKKFLSKQSPLNTLLLAVSIAFMILSKYQSVLVVFFVILSNINLLKKPQIWVAGFISLLLISPHIYWQYINDYPSFKYHLVDRSSQFKLNYFLEYWPNQIAIFNPFALGLGLFIVFKNKWSDLFTRSLYFLIVGFLVFFWIMCYRGHAEPHWTVVVSIAFITIIYKTALQNNKVRGFIKRFLTPVVILIFLVRIGLLIDPVAEKFNFHGSEKYEAISKVAGNKPVIFHGSFQAPSLYTYYTKKPSTTISSIYNRRTQFDIWQLDKEFEGKPAFICAEIDGKSKTFNINDNIITGFEVDKFNSGLRLKTDFIIEKKEFYSRGDTLKVLYSIINPYKFEVVFKDSVLPLELSSNFFTKKIKNTAKVLNDIEIYSIKSMEKIAGEFLVIVPDLPEGEYNFSVSIRNVFGPSLEKGINTRKYPVLSIK